MKGDNDAAIDFLKHWNPTEPWVLTAITVEQRGLEGATFRPDTEAALRTWLEKHNGTHNIYFNVNTLTKEMNGKGAKASKVDVASMDWVHIDLDPRIPDATITDLAEWNASERLRILRLIQNFQPRPTVIIDSGGGYQAFWKLEVPQSVNGVEARAIELEGYNIQMEVVLGADAVHNLDRVMRLPGTVNIPNEKKRKKGRVEALAQVVEANWELVYPIAKFPRAVVKVQESSSLLSRDSVSIPGNIKFFTGPDDLPPQISQKTKMLIVQGEDPDEPQRFPSRSEACWFVTCQLVRDGLTDEDIARVLLDPDFKISGHILHQSNPHNYTARQIRRAREENDNPNLRELNDAHMVIADIGGKCRVATEVFDSTLKRSRLSLQSFDDFRNRYMHKMVSLGLNPKGEEIKISLGKYWLLNKDRRQYERIVFRPGVEVTGLYNLWKGFAFPAVAGDWTLFREHIRDIVCSGNPEHFDYLMNWMARAVQRPGELGEVAVVLRGGMGAGKGTFVQHFGAIWGRHFLQVSNPKHLVGQFNAHFRDCSVMFADEAFFAGDRSHESILKTIITEKMLITEAKGIDPEPTANFVHLILASNSTWVIPVAGDDRRFFVADVADTKTGDIPYFTRIAAQMNAGGYEAMLYELLNRDLSSFDHRKMPKTEALLEQKTQSLAPIEEWWQEKLMDGRIGRREDWPTEILKDAVTDDVVRYFDRQKISRRPSPTILGKFLSRMMPPGMPKSSQRWTTYTVTGEYGDEIKSGRFYVYDFAPLDVCRQLWEKKMGSKIPWPSNEGGPSDDKAPF